jgi:Ca2+-binding EF-hand superfamily protein
MSTLTEKQKAYHLLKMRTRAIRTDVNQDGVLSREDFELIVTRMTEYGKLTKEQSESVHTLSMKMADASGLKPGVKIPVELAAQKNSEKLLSLTPEQQKGVVQSFQGVLFDTINTSKSGYISVEEFKVYFRAICPDLPEEEVTRSFNTVDTNKDGKLSLDEWMATAQDYMFGVEETDASNYFFGHLLP